MSGFIFKMNAEITDVIHRAVKLQINIKRALFQQCNCICNGGIELPVFRSGAELLLVILDDVYHKSISSYKNMLVKRKARLQVSKAVGDDDGIRFMRHVTTLASNIVGGKI